MFLVATALFWGAMPLVAQNVIVNGDFQQGNTGFDTEYAFVGSGLVSEGQYCIDVNASGHGGGTNGWPSVTGYGGSGMYMIVNGFGNTYPTPKVVWKQTVDVTSQTNYTFSCQLVNLSQGILFLDPMPAIIQLKINGVDVGGSLTLNPSSHDWQAMNRTWNSGNCYGLVEIAIYDLYSGSPGLGDDFGLDEILFIPGMNYTVTANDDNYSVCLNVPMDFPVLSNDVILPDANDAIVSVVENPAYGTAEVLSDKRIRYLFNDENHIGATDQFKYRVTNHGRYDEAWVTVSLGGAPSNIVYSGIPEDHLCVADFAGFSPSGTCNNGSPITDSGWEWASDPNGPWNTLNLSPFDLPIGDYYLRFWAENDCGRAESNPIPLRICDEPVLNTMTISDPPLICEGALLPQDYITQVGVTNWNNDAGAAGWEVKQGYDPWMPLYSVVTLSEGDQLRYRAENCCGEVVTNMVILHVTQGPEFTGQPYTYPFEPSYCMGEVLPMPGDHPQYETHGMATEGFWAYWDGDEYQRIVGNPTLTEEWDGRRITYVLDSDCGGLIPYPDPFVITVVLPPEIQAVMVSPSTVCVGNPIEADSVVDWHHGTPDLQQCTWQYASVANPTNYHNFSPSDGIPNTGEYYVNYHATNTCGLSGDCSSPAVISVITADDEWVDVSVCDSLVLESGEVIYESQVIESESYEPCYHTIYQNVIIHHADTVQEPITSCHDEFDWHDQHFERSEVTQIAYWTTTNMFGCDSVVELHLDFGDYAAITEVRVACNEYVWPRNGHLYTESQNDSYFIPGSGAVCDSMIYLNLTIGHDTEVERDTTSCEPILWYGHTFDFDGERWPHTFQTSEGCDSTVWLTFHLPHPTTNTQFKSVCDADTINGVIYGPGNYDLYLDTLYDVYGCDSIIYHVNLAIRDSGNTGLIQGESSVYVATNLITGIYRYEIDPEVVLGSVIWNLSNPEWSIVGSDANSCRVLVTTPGSGVLRANFLADCGEMKRQLTIHAGFYDVAEYQSVEAHVFPNPTQGQVTVEAEGIESVRVIDMLGQTLDKIAGEGSDRLTFDIQAFKPSIYLLEIKTVKGTAMERLVLCR